jgi:uncharacterized protein YjbJ (UPF0337 family)
MDSNEIKGAARDVEGKIKDGYGGLTGDTGTQVDGKIDQAAGKIQAQYGEAVDKVSDLRSKLSETMDSVQSKARETGQAAYAKTARLGEAVDGAVHESPWLSVIGMAAIGYVAAFLIHSPSSPLAPRAPEPRYLPRRLARYI